MRVAVNYGVQETSDSHREDNKIGSELSTDKLPAERRKERCAEVGKVRKPFGGNGEPAGTRTQDPRLKRALLYQLSYGLAAKWLSCLL